ncbi:MAG: threonine synthase [Caldithrix sp.]|nr:threonine synthase [Caldithrix sp.]
MVGHQLTPFNYRCTQCGRHFERDAVTYLCPHCSIAYQAGQTLCGVLQAEFDYDYIRRYFNPAAPDWQLFSAVEASFSPSLPVGQTPYFQAYQLESLSGLSNIYLKNDGLNPSGSLKDRASYLVVAEAKRKDIDTVVTASTGNAASALAAVCASCGMKAVIFAPASAPKAKLLQILLYGGQLITVDGSYDDAFSLSLAYSQRNNVLNRNTAYHPLTIEGKKSAALEILTQNGMHPPQAVIVPVGDGVIISGMYKGFYDLMDSGITDRLPRLIGVQAEKSAAIHRYLQTGCFSALKTAQTIADSISVAVPSNAYMARQAILQSGGFTLTVSDEDIMQAQQLLAANSGIFAEPAAAATLAGLLKDDCRNELNSKGSIVLLITGHGLKDIATPLEQMRIPAAQKPQAILDNMEAI